MCYVTAHMVTAAQTIVGTAGAKSCKPATGGQGDGMVTGVLPCYSASELDSH